MAEWGNLYVIGAIATTLFLGGWQIPFALEGAPVLRHLLQLGVFLGKAYFVGVIVAIWVRWTLPRIRVDQMMTMCWKYLVPIAFVNLLGTATWMVLFPHGVPAVRLVLAALAGAATAGFLWRVRYHLRRAKLTRRHLIWNPLGTTRVPGIEV
jgi:NADH-quinone oxidoreductase subunit H